MRVRSKAREIALCIIYQAEILKIPLPEATNNYFLYHSHPEKVTSFSKILIEGIYANCAFLDGVIKKYTRNWNLERMAIIDRNILRMGCYEIFFLDDVPPKVAINEAIELAKKFGDIDSPRFINGILDRIYKSEKKE